MSDYNRASIRTGSTESSKDFPAATVKDHVRYHVERGTDYATAYARVCGQFADMRPRAFDQLFDHEWDKQGGL